MLGILCTEESDSMKLNLHAFCLKDNKVIVTTYKGAGLYVYEIIKNDFNSLNEFKEHVLTRIYKINRNK